MAYAPRNKGGYDQWCLTFFVWPWAKRRSLAHDSYTCEKVKFPFFFQAWLVNWLNTNNDEPIYVVCIVEILHSIPCATYSSSYPLQFPKSVAFPTRRSEGIGNFVGSVVSHNSSISLDKSGECPPKCRPAQHLDWLYC